MFFSKLLKDYSRTAEKKLNLSATFEYVLLVQRNLCSVVEIILKFYWKVLNMILNKSLNSIISQLCFQLNRGENGKYNISSNNDLKTEKNSRVKRLDH
jgi:hypothetical protein